MGRGTPAPVAGSGGGGGNPGRAAHRHGLILAASFALLALVPLTTFRAVALMVSLGLLLDAFLVRQLLVGRRGGWPGRRLDRGDRN